MLAHMILRRENDASYPSRCASVGYGERDAGTVAVVVRYREILY
jgi:hypothetical protein